VSFGVGKGRPSDNSITLDKIDPKLGYAAGNVALISWRANRLKSNATPDELQQLADYAKRHTRGDWLVEVEPPARLAA
jgi:hypothetical protein